MTQSTQTQNTYFNLTCDGIGFLNRPRTVKTKKGEYFACTIQASRGDANDKTRFDLRVVGNEAKSLFAQLLEDFPALTSTNFRDHPTVVVGFRAGDIVAMTFETTDRQTGEKIQTPTIDGRLLKFKFIKVNGELWYTEKSADTASTEA